MIKITKEDFNLEEEFIKIHSKKINYYRCKSTLFELRTKEIFANYSVSLESRAKFIY